MTDRDVYTDGLMLAARRNGRYTVPAHVVTRMPTRYELGASRAAVARQRRVLDGIGILLAIVAVALVAWILLK